MFPFNEFPYTNFHEMNLDWLLNTVKELSEKLKTVGVLPAPVDGEEGWIATVVDGMWKADGRIPQQVETLVSDFAGMKLENEANFRSINTRLDEIYEGIIQLSMEFDNINRMVVV